MSPRFGKAAVLIAAVFPIGSTIAFVSPIPRLQQVNSRSRDWKQCVVVDDFSTQRQSKIEISNSLYGKHYESQLQLLFRPNGLKGGSPKSYLIIPKGSIIGSASNRRISESRIRHIPGDGVLESRRNCDPSGMILRSFQGNDKETGGDSEDQNDADESLSKRLRSKLGRILRIGQSGDSTINPIYMDDNKKYEESEESEETTKGEMPQWLKEKQDEMERLRQMEKSTRAQQQVPDVQKRDTSEVFRYAPPPVSTTSQLQNMMQGMPSLQDMFGVSGNGKIDNPQPWQPTTSQDSSQSRKAQEIPEGREDVSLELFSDALSENDLKKSSSLLASAKTKEGLQKRLQALLEQAGSQASPGRLDEIEALSPPTTDRQLPIEKSTRQSVEGFKNLQKASISDQRYRSFRKGNVSGEDKRQQFEDYLKREQELRDKVGLTGSLEERQEMKLREMQLEKERNRKETEKQDKQSSITGDVKDLADSSPKSPSDSTTNKSGASPDRTTVVFDAYGSDPSMRDWKPKTLSVEEARFRSFAKRKGAPNSDGGMSAYEAFLKKEQEMREKLRMQEENITFETPTSEPIRGARNEPKQADSLVASENSEQTIVDQDGFKPKRASVADQKYRALAKKGGDSSDKKAAYEAFLKREKEMRQKLGSDLSSFDETQYFIGEETSSSTQTTKPRTSFYAEEKDFSGSRSVSKSIDSSTSTSASNKWKEVEELYNTEHSIKDEYEIEDEIEEELKEYKPSGPYDLAADLFKSDYTKERPKIEESTFSSFDFRRNDLLQLTELSVDDINLLFEFESPYLSRLASKNNPDAAFGAIFRLEGTLVDTSKLELESWKKTAENYGFRKPDEDEVRRAVLMRPENAVRDEFYWTTDILESRQVALFHQETLQELFDRTMEKIKVSKVMIPVGSLLAEAKYDVRYGSDTANHTAALEAFPVSEGAIEWLRRLAEVKMPCAVISHLDSAKLDTVLNVTGLSEFFPRELRVSASAGYEWERQEYLGACLRLGRRPNKCVVFESTPSSSKSAHEVDLKAIAIMGLYPMYELSTADLAVSSFEELTTLNVRRLFSDTNFDPETQLQQEIAPQVKRKKLRMWSEGDRD